jgi:small subunit ribosomal protein S1
MTTAPDQESNQAQDQPVEMQATPETNTPESTSNNSNGEANKAASANDPMATLREAQRTKKSLQAKVIKWQRNGLEMELEDGTPAFMPNDMIDRDPNRNIANYFGKTLPVKITNIKPNSEKAPVTVSHRAVLEEELREQGKEHIQNLKVGDVIEGKVKSFSNQGVMLDIGTGIEAVIRLKDLSWEPFDHPYEIVKRGETLQAKILQVDKGRRRVQLGVRQLTADPMDEKYKSYTEGQTVNGKISRINDFGAEVELSDGMIAFLPISEISWTRIPTVRDAVSEGEEIEAKVIRADADARKLTISKKQMTENPLRKAEGKFKVGSDHDGKVKSADRSGVVVDFGEDGEGFIPRRELSHDRVERVEDSFKPGMALEGMRVIEFDRRSGRPTLSLVAAEREEQHKTLKNYKASAKATSFTIGDLSELKAKLEKIERGG